MNCEDATNLISAKIDREISAVDQAALDQHLSACPACRSTLEALSAQDAELARAFAPRRAGATAVADAAIERIHRERTIKLHQPRRFPFLNTILSAAAGFAIALLILQPWETNTGVGPGVGPTTVAKDAVAHLALATGTIEVRPAGKTEWQVMPTGASIEANSSIRTPDNTRCELVLSDQSTIRLNGNTEVLLASSRKFDLARGQTWTSVSASTIPFVVAVAQANITALGTEFDIVADPQQPQATLTVIEGSARVDGKAGQRVVGSKNKVQIVNGVPADPEVANIITATRWVNELVMMKGRDNAELQRRVDLLLASIGNEKMAYMMEDEIKLLGDHCVLPLTRYIQSPLSAKEPRRRQQAAKIASEMSQPWSIPEMIGLLKDGDGEVRYHAARALQRLVGHGMGRSPEDWRGQLSSTKYNEWLDWWKNNRERYPTGPMGPTPMPLPMPKTEVKAKS